MIRRLFLLHYKCYVDDCYLVNERDAAYCIAEKKTEVPYYFALLYKIMSNRYDL